jgi:hypothetical protein
MLVKPRVLFQEDLASPPADCVRLYVILKRDKWWTLPFAAANNATRKIVFLHSIYPKAMWSSQYLAAVSTFFLASSTVLKYAKVGFNPGSADLAA